MSDVAFEDSIDIVRKAFETAGLEIVDLQERRYPDEQIFLVSLEPQHLERAGVVAAGLDAQFAAVGAQVLTTVRRAAPMTQVLSTPMPDGVKDPRAIALRQLISSRARTSESQPSFSYIPDSSMNIDAVVAPRHQLIFGRRGAGKTALMLEAKRQAESQAARSVWVNLQTFRLEPVERVFLYVLRGVFDTLLSESHASQPSPTDAMVHDLSSRVRHALDAKGDDVDTAKRLIPDVNAVLKRFLGARAFRLNLYLDDFYYIPRQDQPMLLDMLHACVRDADCWLKIASIRNLTKWFITSPPTGLETGHDADVIDLDVTLQDPARAEAFLESVVTEYARSVGIPSLTALYSKASLDRLTLGSGGVPRDYLVLAGSSIIKTRERDKGRLVGVQDVNQAAGDAAQTKVQELEEDGSANKGVPEQASQALVRVRSFCLDETSFTYFRVRHQDRDSNPEAFVVLNRLVEFRLLHSIAASVSNPHKAGDASEVFMLDLSQYTGSRLKQKLWVLEIENGQISTKRTRDSNSQRTGASARDLIAILRLAPEFELARFGDLVSTFDSIRAGVLRIMRPGVTRTSAELVSELQAPFRQMILTLNELVDQRLLSRAEVEGREIYRSAGEATDVASA